jgi:hypothetical protein
MGNAVVSFANIMQNTQHRVVECDDPYHRHNSPTQDMYSLIYNGHHVALTRDGHEWSVRVDRDSLTDRHHMTKLQAFTYAAKMAR